MGIQLPTLTKEKAESAAFMILSDIAFLTYQNDQKRKFLFVVDLRNLVFRALFVYNPTNKNFDIYASSFKDEKRKYEMLYILERNNTVVTEAFNRG